jgi:hypothetical protein
VVAGSVVVCVLAGSAAHADTVDQANEQARKIAAQIQQLQPEVDAALAAYGTSLDAVGQAVTSNVAAQRVYTALRARADALADQQSSHIAALYKSGGTLTLYADVLLSAHPTDLHRVPLLSDIVSMDAAAAASAARVAVAAKASIDASQALIDSGLANADVVDQRLQQLQVVLGRQQGLLDEVSGHAKQLQAVRDAALTLAASRAAAAEAGAQAAQSVAPYPIPAAFRPLYQAAAQTCPGLSWTVLAAIGQVETHHGSGTMVSSAGALGPMQFLPATFVANATDGNHDGLADIMNPADAIFSAAKYLCRNGAGSPDSTGQGLYSALWNYNHADWYVQLVLALSAKIS